jgi:hypothetical protein
MVVQIRLRFEIGVDHLADLRSSIYALWAGNTELLIFLRFTWKFHQFDASISGSRDAFIEERSLGRLPRSIKSLDGYEGSTTRHYVIWQYVTICAISGATVPAKRVKTRTYQVGDAGNGEGRLWSKNRFVRLKWPNEELSIPSLPGVAPDPEVFKEFDGSSIAIGSCYLSSVRLSCGWADCVESYHIDGSYDTGEYRVNLRINHLIL